MYFNLIHPLVFILFLLLYFLIFNLVIQKWKTSKYQAELQFDVALIETERCNFFGCSLYLFFSHFSCPQSTHVYLLTVLFCLL